jgi:ubiquinone/menaquinone biosynthesis C-methylase UbiE
MLTTRHQSAGSAPQPQAREAVHTLGRPLAERMFAQGSLQASDPVLDAACGTGMVTRVAREQYCN